MNDPDADLRAHLDVLTQPHVARVEDRGRLLGYRTEQPLLVRLRHAITANIGPGNGSKAAHERSTFNGNASELNTEIETRVRQWLLRTAWQRTGTAWPAPETLLQTWYARVYRNHDFRPAGYAATLADWIAQISDLLDPPHRYPLNAPCPVCGQTWIIHQPDGHDERAHALQVVERDPATLSTVTCRGCGAHWDGVEGAEELAEALTGAITVIPQEAAVP